jgi:hypothetical protein
VLQSPREKLQDDGVRPADSTAGFRGGDDGQRRAAAAAQVRRARERAVKRGVARKTHQRAPHLHAWLPKCFTTAGRRRRSEIEAAAG